LALLILPFGGFCTNLISFKCGEFTKNCISTPVRCTMFRSTNDVSIPLRRIDMSTPVKLVGAWSSITVSTDPGMSWAGERREKSSVSIFCFSGVGMVLWRYSMRPLPTLARAGGATTGGGGVRAVLEKGYVTASARTAEEERQRAADRHRESMVTEYALS